MAKVVERKRDLEQKELARTTMPTVVSAIVVAPTAVLTTIGTAVAATEAVSKSGGDGLLEGEKKRLIDTDGKQGERIKL